MPAPIQPFIISPGLPGRNKRIFRYFWSLVLVAAATGLSGLVVIEFSPTNLVMIYLLAVVIAAVYIGRGPAILASILGVLSFDFFFVPPRFTLTVADTEYLLTFASFLSVGLVISYLTTLARQQTEAAQRREAETAALYAFSRELATADDLQEIVTAVLTHTEKTCDACANVFLPNHDRLQVDHREPCIEEDLTYLQAAEWAFAHDEITGHGTEKYAQIGPRLIPLKASHHPVGVLGVWKMDRTSSLTEQQLSLLDAFASQAGQAIERVQLAEQARKIELLQATEKLYNALLNSISHDLRTPLASITGALSTLDEQRATLQEDARQSLVETAREEADRLNRLVGNLLEMSRLEAGALRVVREPTDILDLVGSALGQLESRLANRVVSVDLPQDLPLVEIDFVLIVHVLVYLLDNSIKYSPPASPLEIKGVVSGSEFQLMVADRGLGIPVGDLERVFDKFYRVQRPEQVTGTGLGLAISKGILEAHGGRIWASNRPDGGTCITIALPLEGNDHR